jgi:galactose mutarotase-like enzyme
MAATVAHLALRSPWIPLKVGKRRSGDAPGAIRQDARVSSDVVTLRAGDLEARFVPSAGMVGASLRLHGRELLGLRKGIDAYRARGSTFGIPLLHPWANRLGGFSYSVGDVTVALDSGMRGLRTEEHGLPIHGLLAAYAEWEVHEQTDAAVIAEADLGADPELLEAFPFPHRLALTAALTPGRLTITTTLTATGDRAVPVAFGFHPYFALPDVAREDLVLRHGAMAHVGLDERGLPTGDRTPVAARDAPLGDDTFDDLYTNLGPAPAVTLAGDRRELTLRLMGGYTHLQLFAPAGTTSVAIEPMTAPVDALRSGDGLRLAAPGEPFTAVFAVDVRDLAQEGAPGT